jgi:hypothetical protein
LPQKDKLKNLRFKSNAIQGNLAEYQTVLQETQQIRKYWEDKNCQRLAQIAKIPPKPGNEDIHAKLQTWKAKLCLWE